MKKRRVNKNITTQFINQKKKKKKEIEIYSRHLLSNLHRFRAVLEHGTTELISLINRATKITADRDGGRGGG